MSREELVEQDTEKINALININVISALCPEKDLIIPPAYITVTLVNALDIDASRDKIRYNLVERISRKDFPRLTKKIPNAE